ncbi:hypothetical protein BK645_10085 [Pseudomonas protegens]|uniref:hypothetical protein n=1 Tax=Pseudomonas protegens TaxID=380021 RepID=UPI0002E7EC7B|nr:hypothetical protein [Pseudomonas protegens]ROM29309.1 hypothetical protein BK645_10085 [Pseudomonas protegens]ROM36942.1 hypothetical protein BK646_18130 [Pseudomonas protegens]
MKTRKPNNARTRVERACRGLVRTNHVAVVNIDPSGRQGMINYKSLKNIAPGKIGQAVCGIPHRWTIYMSAMCLDARGDRYSKSIELAPDGVYLSDHLEEVIEHCYMTLRAEANQAQMVASGWIAIPDTVSLDEEHAARIFEAVGAWHQVKVDSCAA